LVLRAIGEPVSSFWSGTPSGWMAVVIGGTSVLQIPNV
jgi:hypothetical protein